jgi:uncharacterized alkaline shock family protein YloU
MTYVLEGADGTITVTSPVLSELVTRAAEGVDGVQVRRGRRRLDVDVSDGSARVRVELTARYGVVLPRLARHVQERVTEALATMCGVKVETVDVSVEEIE